MTPLPAPSPAPSPAEVGAVVPAAGRGDRMPGPVPKQFRELAGAPLFWHALRRLAATGLLGQIVVVLPPSDAAAAELPADLGTPLKAVAGGRRRQDSVARGVAALGPGIGWVVVHDGARPFLPPEVLYRCLAAARESGAVIAALPAAETVKQAGPGGFSERTLPREGLWLAQTPQVARRDLLERALAAAEAQGLEATDEAALLEAAGVRVKLVEGARGNIKVTSEEDLALAEAMLAQPIPTGRLREAGGAD